MSEQTDQDARSRELQERLNQINQRLVDRGILPPPPPPPPGALESFGHGFVKSVKTVPVDLATIGNFVGLPTGYTDEELLARRNELEQLHPSPGVSGFVGSSLGSAAQLGPVGVGAAVGRKGLVKGITYATAASQAAQQAGGRVGEDFRYEQETGEEVSDTATAFGALGHATVVGLASFLGIEALINPKFLGPDSLNKIGKAMTLRQSGVLTTKQAALVISKQIPSLSARGSFIEGIEESIEQVGTNIVDKFTSPQPPGLLEGVGQSFAGGAIAGGVVGPAFGLASGKTAFKEQQKENEARAKVKRKAREEDIKSKRQDFIDVVDDLYEGRKGKVNATKKKLTQIAKSLNIDTKGLTLEQIRDEIKTSVEGKFDPRQEFLDALSVDQEGNIGVSVETKGGVVDLTPDRGRKSRPFESGQSRSTTSPASEKTLNEAKVGTRLSVELPNGTRVKATVTKATRGRLTLTVDPKQDKALASATQARVYVRLESGEVKQTRLRIPKKIVLDRKTGKTITKFTTVGRVGGTAVESKPVQRKKKKKKSTKTEPPKTEPEKPNQREAEALKSVEEVISREKSGEVRESQVLVAILNTKGFPNDRKAAERMIDSLRAKGLLERFEDKFGRTRYRLPGKQGKAKPNPRSKPKPKKPLAPLGLATVEQADLQPTIALLTVLKMRGQVVSHEVFEEFRDADPNFDWGGAVITAQGLKLLEEGKNSSGNTTLTLTERGRRFLNGQSPLSEDGPIGYSRRDGGRGATFKDGKITRNSTAKRWIGRGKGFVLSFSRPSEVARKNKETIKSLIDEAPGKDWSKQNNLKPPPNIEDISDGLKFIMPIAARIGVRVIVYHAPNSNSLGFITSGSESVHNKTTIGINSALNHGGSFGSDTLGIVDTFIHEIMHLMRSNGIKNADNVIETISESDLDKMRRSLWGTKPSYRAVYDTNKAINKTLRDEDGFWANERAADEEAFLFFFSGRTLPDLLRAYVDGNTGMTIQQENVGLDLTLPPEKVKAIVDNWFALFSPRDRKSLINTILRESGQAEVENRLPLSELAQHVHFNANKSDLRRVLFASPERAARGVMFTDGTMAVMDATKGVHMDLLELKKRGFQDKQLAFTFTAYADEISGKVFLFPPADTKALQKHKHHLKKFGFTESSKGGRDIRFDADWTVATRSEQNLNSLADDAGSPIVVHADKSDLRRMFSSADLRHHGTIVHIRGIIVEDGTVIIGDGAEFVHGDLEDSAAKAGLRGVKSQVPPRIDFIVMKDGTVHADIRPDGNFFFLEDGFDKGLSKAHKKAMRQLGFKEKSDAKVGGKGLGRPAKWESMWKITDQRVLNSVHGLDIESELNYLEKNLGPTVKEAGARIVNNILNTPPAQKIKGVQKFGQGFLKGVFQASMDMIDWTTKPMVDRLADTPTGNILRQAAREAETETNRIQGRLKQYIVDISKFTGEQGMAEAMLAGKLSASKIASILKNTPAKLRGQVEKAIELSRILQPEMDGNSGFSRLQLMVEGKIPVEPIAEPLVNAMRKFHIETSRIMKERGILQNIHGDLKVFKESKEGKVFVRQFTPPLVNLVASGVSNDNKALKVLIDELVKLNPVSKGEGLGAKQKGSSRAQIERLFKELSSAIQNRNGDVIRQTHAEVRRLVENFPTHIKVNGEIIQLLHTDPIVYSMKLANNVALRMGYISQFGQHQFSGKDFNEFQMAALRAEQGIGEFEGLSNRQKGDLLRKIQKDLEAGTTIEGKHDHPWVLRMLYAGEGNNVKPFNELMDVWNRIPLEAPVLGGKFLPGNQYYKVGVFMDESLKLYKSLLLSTQAIVNIPETFLGAAAAMAGGKNMLAAMGFGRRGKPGDLDNMREFVRNQTQVMYNNGDFAFDRNHPLWSVSRIVREGIGVGTLGKVINELQDITAARAAYLKQLDWGRGESDTRDRALLEIMGFSKEEAMLMLTPDWKVPKNQAQKVSDLRAKFVQDSPGFFVSSSKTVFSESRAGQSRTFKAVFAFTAYARARMRQNIEIMRLLARSYKTSKTDPNLFKSANNLAVRHFGFSALQGSLAYMLLALVFGGPDEVEQQMREALKSPDKFGKFMLTSLAYSLVGGPYAQIFRLLTPEGAALPERAVRATFPGAVISEAYDFFSGRNIYKDRTITERVEAFFSKRIPLGRAATNGLGVLGISDRDPELEAALKGYWRWKRDNDIPFVRVDKFNEDKETKWFRINMRRALGEMREGRSPEKFIREAVRVKGTNSIKQSLRSRLLFRDLDDEQVAKVRETLGESGFNKLVSYNNVIAEWAKRVR